MFPGRGGLWPGVASKIICDLANMRLKSGLSKLYGDKSYLCSQNERRMNEITKPGKTYEGLVEQISERYERGRRSATIAVNSHIVDTYWNVGRDIVEFEQHGSDRAAYGSRLLEKLSKDLTTRHGKGFSLSNVKRMRQFYTVYPIGTKASHQLSWSHYVEMKSPLFSQSLRWLITFLAR